jgi:spore maturation protein CgeB
MIILKGNNKLLWHLPEDLKLFKAITSNTTIVMGYNTFMSIGKPLPNRKTIVIGSEIRREQLHHFENLKDNVKVMTLDLFNAIRKLTPHEVYIIVGGESLYSEPTLVPNIVFKTVVDFESEIVPRRYGNETMIINPAYAKYNVDLSGYLQYSTELKESVNGSQYTCKCYVKV